jgi:hypothetical protein
MFGFAGGSTWEGWVIAGDKRKSGENTIPESRRCSDSCLKKTEEKSVGVLFKLSVGELSGELFDIKLFVVGEFFDIKSLVEKLFFHFTELFFSKMFIGRREERGEGEGESGSVLIGFWSFECRYVLTVLFSRENDRFFL